MLHGVIAVLFLIATVDTGDPAWAIAAGLFAVTYGLTSLFLLLCGDEEEQ